MANKLVRDKIVDIISAQGQTVKQHIADDAEYWQSLKDKLEEELSEFLEAETLDEYIDLLEVLEAVAEFKQFSASDIRNAKNTKAEKRGKFKKRIIAEF